MLRKLTSMDSQLPQESQQDISACKTGSRNEEESSLRRERRFKSAKQAPRVILPLSDRKLPKVFKMAGM